MAKGRTAIKIKTEKLAKQNLALKLGTHKPLSRNRHLLSKFSPKQERAYRAPEAKPVVPEYDPAMVKVIPMHKPRQRKAK